MSSPIVAEQLLHFTHRGVPSADEARGPTPVCCWLVPQLILWGDAPRGPRLAALVDAGVFLFLDVRGGATAGDYLGSSTPGATYRHIDLPKLLALGSGSAVNDLAMSLKDAIARALIASKSSPRCIVYLHCEDGTTLSAVAASAILAFAFGLSGLKAAAIAAQLHGTRADANQGKIALTASHKAFLKDLCQNQSPIAVQQESPLPQDAPAAAQPGGRVDPMNSSTIKAAHPERRGSRFEHSSGTGGGLTTLNLFHGNDEVASSQHQQQQQQQQQHAGFVTPTKRSLMMTANAGSSPSHSTTTLPTAAAAVTLTVPPMLQVGALVASEAEQRVQWTPSGGSRRSEGSRSPVSSLALSPARDAAHRSSSSGVLEGGFRILHLQRASLAHAWGLILAHGSRVVQFVLPCSPAEQSGCVPGMELRTVGNGEFADGDYLDWIARDHLTLTLTVLWNGGGTTMTGALSSPPSTTRSSEELPAVFDPRAEASLIRGPTPLTNWVVRDRVLCGPAPEPRNADFEALVAANIDLFVVLTEEAPTYLEQYTNRWIQMRRDSAADRPRVLHHPMTSGAPFTEAFGQGLLRLTATLTQELESSRGSRVYIHCLNGHGRTGIVVSLLLAQLYQLPAMRAVNLCNALHGCRKNTEDQSSPQTDKERRCVLDTLNLQA